MELVTLRFLHLVFGFLWAAGAVIMGFWVTPAAVEAGPGGGAVLQGVNVQRKLPIWMLGASTITILCGLRLYMMRYDPSWVMTPESIVLLLGSLFALGGFFIGLFVQRPLGGKIGALGQQIAAADGPPTDEQKQQMAELQGRLLRVSRVLGAHLAAAVVLMSFARVAALM